jgi:protein SCO1/2
MRVISSLALLIVLAVGFADAAAPQRLHGVVLAVTPKSGEAIVRHDPFGSMPAMSMPFRIIPAEKVRQLQVGSQIDAVVDTSTEPWTLRDVVVRETQALTDNPVPRNVLPLRLGDLVPDTAFVDQNGAPFRFSQLRGQNVLLSFVFTRCQDPRMCPLISAKYHQLQRAMGERRLHLVEVTLDPSYDRPPVLARYARTFGADPRRWTLAVGDAEPTLDFAARFGITAFPDPNAGLVHTENTVEIDRDGRVRAMLAEPSWAPDEILADVDALDGIASNPLARLDLWLSREAVALCGSSVAGFSGLTDLVIVLTIFGALVYLMVRLARGLFARTPSA